MVIRLLVPMAGTAQAWAAGDLYECDESAARRLIAAGRGVPVTAGPASIEMDEIGERVETAMRPRAKGRPA